MSSDFPFQSEDRKRDGQTGGHAKEKAFGVERVDKLDIIHGGGVCVCVCEISLARCGTYSNFPCLALADS